MEKITPHLFNNSPNLQQIEEGDENSETSDNQELKSQQSDPKDIKSTSTPNKELDEKRKLITSIFKNLQ